MLWDEPKIFFLERRYFFSIILSEFLKNRVALQELLYIHKNTVHYRLNKIRSVLRCDLVQMPATLAVYEAATVYRILKEL